MHFAIYSKKDETGNFIYTDQQHDYYMIFVTIEKTVYAVCDVIFESNLGSVRSNVKVRKIVLMRDGIQSIKDYDPTSQEFFVPAIGGVAYLSAGLLTSSFEDFKNENKNVKRMDTEKARYLFMLFLLSLPVVSADSVDKIRVYHHLSSTSFFLNDCSFTFKLNKSKR